MTQPDRNQNLTAGIEGSIATTCTCTSTSTGRPRFTKETIGTIPLRLVKYIRRRKNMLSYQKLDAGMEGSIATTSTSTCTSTSTSTVHETKKWHRSLQAR